MKNRHLLLLACGFLSGFFFEAAGQKTAIVRPPRLLDDRIEFSYDIPKLEKDYLWNVRFRIAGSPVQPISLTGTGDKRKAGSNQLATWKFTENGLTRSQVAALGIELLVENTGRVDHNNKWILTASSCTAAAAAGGFFIYESGRLKKRAEADHAAYLAKNFPKNASWLPFQPTRKAEFEAASKKFRNAQILKTTGAVAIGGAAFFAVRKLLNQSSKGRKKADEKGLSFAPASGGAGIFARF